MIDNKCWADNAEVLARPCPNRATVPDCPGGMCIHRMAAAQCNSLIETDLGVCLSCWSDMTGRPAEEARR